jgi:predicted amidohydrolase
MLKEAIDDFKAKGKSLDNALVVIPEAFNIRKPYCDKEPPNVDTAVLGELARVSEDNHCAFVAGLIIADTPGIDPPYSSAYLIDGLETRQRLSRKALADDTEVSRSLGRDWAANYTAYGSFQSSSILHRGIAISVLICVDAQYETNNSPVHTEACKALAVELRGHKAPYQVLCVPACLLNGFCNGDAGANVGDNLCWTDTIQILANRYPNKVRSFISNTRGLILEPTAKEKENWIETLPLEKCS